MSIATRISAERARMAFQTGGAGVMVLKLATVAAFLLIAVVLMGR